VPGDLAQIATDYAVSNRMPSKLDSADVTGVLSVSIDDPEGLATNLIFYGVASQTSVNDVPTVAEFEARTIVSANYATASAVGNVQASVDDVPTNSELATALGTADDAVLAAIAALNNLSNAQLTAAIAAGDDATLAAIAALTIPTAAENSTAVWTTALTEAYRATGAQGTAAQLLYELLANLTDFSISGTTKTARKLDGTAAKTYTLNDATSPTATTEAT
jgi:hypothetical protein